MMQWEIDELLKLFRINLDRKSAAYRELGLEVLGVSSRRCKLPGGDRPKTVR
jgi:hypothetical protein